MKRRTGTPSNAVQKGTIGTAIGGVVELAAAMAGHPLPAGSGAVLGGLLSQIFAYHSKGGRKGEAD
jgi:hypothetical protein